MQLTGSAAAAAGIRGASLALRASPFSSARSCCFRCSRSSPRSFCRGLAGRQRCGPRACSSSRWCCWRDICTRMLSIADLQPRAQVWLHIGLLAASLLLLPVIPNPAGNRWAARTRPAHSRTAGGHDRCCRTFCSRPPARCCRRGTARAGGGALAVPAVRAVECGLDAGAADLSGAGRAKLCHAPSGDGAGRRGTWCSWCCARRWRCARAHGRRSAAVERIRRTKHAPAGGCNCSGWRWPPARSTLLLAVTNHLTQNVAVDSVSVDSAARALSA